ALAIGNALTLYDLPAVLQEPPPDQKSETGAKQMTLKEMEKNYILETMEACDWNHEMASKQLAIGRTTLWRKLREYKIGNDSERKG
ncbi:MAG: hypothetical protein GWN61_18675, partial [candidate division Zixibacteria bacterium]|nr:hypothetical protein [candidate division KSB1 bacterium]NIR66287.1 hypothetical protein [candidate division Zixibacteria bacterium]NIS47876.1 hypothetical protein [candidate division Zixibacteria bacterium]NIT73541.1 hypothetical protein [candidate division KSB1 bacterium]NIU15994.1 hypothetical protein [candidate division Zixibacteria bacterium]